MSEIKSMLENTKLEESIDKYRKNRNEWSCMYELSKMIANRVYNYGGIIVGLYDSDSNNNNKQIDYLYNYENASILADEIDGNRFLLIFTSKDKFLNTSLDLVGGVIEMSEIIDIISDAGKIDYIFINPETDNLMLTKDELDELEFMVKTTNEFEIDNLEFEKILKSDIYIEDLEADVIRIYNLLSERINDFCFDFKNFEEGGGLESEVFAYVFVMHIISKFIFNYNSKGILKKFVGLDYDNDYHIKLREKIIKTLDEYVYNDYKKNELEALIPVFRNRLQLYDNVLSGSVRIGGSWISMDNEKFGSDIYGKMILVWGDSIFYPESIDDYENYFSYPLKLLPESLEIEMQVFLLRSKINQWVFTIGDWISALLKDDKNQ
ncbi:MAG: SseB family protein [Eubacterium sp.]|nr:SseB family protein [Eubacterium sp.]